MPSISDRAINALPVPVAAAAAAVHRRPELAAVFASHIRLLGSDADIAAFQVEIGKRASAKTSENVVRCAINGSVAVAVFDQRVGVQDQIFDLALTAGEQRTIASHAKLHPSTAERIVKASGWTVEAKLAATAKVEDPEVIVDWLLTDGDQLDDDELRDVGVRLTELKIDQTFQLSALLYLAPALRNYVVRHRVYSFSYYAKGLSLDPDVVDELIARGGDRHDFGVDTMLAWLASHPLAAPELRDRIAGPDSPIRDRILSSWASEGLPGPDSRFWELVSGDDHDLIVDVVLATQLPRFQKLEYFSHVTARSPELITRDRVKRLCADMQHDLRKYPWLGEQLIRIVGDDHADLITGRADWSPWFRERRPSRDEHAAHVDAAAADRSRIWTGVAGIEAGSSGTSWDMAPAAVHFQSVPALAGYLLDQLGDATTPSSAGAWDAVIERILDTPSETIENLVGFAVRVAV